MEQFVAVRAYRAPQGRVDDLPVSLDVESVAALKALAAREIYPAAEFLRTGQCSVTLEDDDCGLDRACEIVDPANIGRVLPSMIRKVSRALSLTTLP
jgi:hypothetical protein